MTVTVHTSTAEQQTMEDLDTNGGNNIKTNLNGQGIPMVHVLSYLHSIEHSFFGLTDYNNVQ